MPDRKLTKHSTVPRKNTTSTPDAPAHGSNANLHAGEIRRIPVFVVVPPRLLLLDIAGPIEVLRQANRVQSSVRFEVRYIGPTSSLLTSVGIMLSGIEPLPEELPPQSWVVL